MRYIVRRLLITGLASILVAGIALLCAYWASRQTPGFYRQTLAASPTTQADDGQRLERTALNLHNQLQRAGRWEACLTQDEINGWLATDLPAKFPRALPPGVSQPRIAIDDGRVRLAVRYQRGAVDTVLSITGEAYLTAQPNEIAVRLDQARAGLVPVPMAKLLNEISDRAARANLPLRWTEVRGAPVALIRLPLDADDEGPRRTVLDRLHASRGQLVLGGRTQTDDSPGGAPQPSTAAQAGDKDTRQR